MKPKVRFIVPVWGKHYVKRFNSFSLLSFLAPGNLPALAELTDLEIVILTSAANYADFEADPGFQSLRLIAPLRFIPIDDLIVDEVYGITLTLAYLRGVTDSGNDMINIHFLFMNSDIVLADGSLSSVAKHILSGRHIILANSIRATSEELIGPLHEAIDRQKHVLAIPSRQLVSMAMKSLHPTQIAKIVNSDLCHSINVNQFYWQVDANTLISRHFLMFMLCLKPERVVTEVHAFCDYSFVPEMCPSGGAVAMEDSDEFFALEMQYRESENSYLRIGRATLDEIAKSLSAWTTRDHRENSLNHTLIFHGEELPEGTDAMMREADRYIRSLHERLTPEPQPYRNHPYWVGSYVRWRARKAFLEGTGELPLKRMTPNAPPRIQLEQSVIHKLYRTLFGYPPRVPIWHPDWLDFRLVTETINAHMKRPDKKILYVKQNIGLFNNYVQPAIVATVDEILFGMLRDDSVEKRSLTLALVEPQREELRHIRKVTDILKPFMASGGQIVVFFKDSISGPYSIDLAGELTRLVGYIAPQELYKTSFSFAGGSQKKKIHNLLGWAIQLYSRYGLIALPISAGLATAVFVLSAINNKKQVAIQDSRRPIQDCSSFLMTISM